MQRNGVDKVRYRILETPVEGEMAGCGVAYENEGGILLFVPGWRAITKLSAPTIFALDEQHFPSRKSGYRWGEVRIWEDDAPFYAIEALERHGTALWKREGDGMQKLDKPTGEFPKTRPLEEASPAGSLWKRWSVPLAAVFSAVALVGIILWIFWTLANPPVPPVPPGEEVFLREVYILVDSSGSMKVNAKDREESPLLREAKQIILSRIFPNLGPGDRVYCYRIGPGFAENRYRIFRALALPGAPGNLLNPDLASRVPAENVTELWRRVEEVKSKWKSDLDALQHLPRNEDASDYLSAFSYLAQRVREKSGPTVKERLIVVLGDLEQDGFPRGNQLYDSPTPPSSRDDEERSAFKGLEVRLLYPYRSDEERPHSRYDPEALTRYWKTYFSERGNDKVVVKTFQDAETILSPSSVPGRGSASQTP